MRYWEYDRIAVQLFQFNKYNRIGSFLKKNIFI